VIPGGYSSKEKGELGQFNRRDTRTVKQVKDDLKKLGLEAVFKDWDRCFGA
jgi:2-iminoacetate synthase ThiH